MRFSLMRRGPPQAEGARRARLEARTASMQPGMAVTAIFLNN